MINTNNPQFVYKFNAVKLKTESLEKKIKCVALILTRYLNIKYTLGNIVINH